MARLLMTGFESASLGTIGSTQANELELGSGFQFSGFGGSYARADSTHPRTGGFSTYAARFINGNASGNCTMTGSLFQLSLTKTYYARVCVLWPNWPISGIRRLVGFYDQTGTTEMVTAVVDSSGNAFLYVAGAQVGSGLSLGSAGTYHVFEIAWNHTTSGASTTDYAECRIDGSSIAVTNTGALTATTGDNIIFAFGTALVAGQGSTFDIAYFDDVAVNDSTGAFCNSWCGLGSIGMMLPVSDNSVGTWLAGAGGGSNLFNALKNVPPVGLAAGSETNTSQINNTNATGNQAYTVNIESYTTFGITNQTLVACCPVTFGGVGTAVSTTLGIACTNPTQSSHTGAFSTAIGTFPTNWGNPLNYFNNLNGGVNPSGVALGTQPTITLNKVTAAATELDSCFAGMNVEVLPATVVATTPIVRNPVLRRKSQVIITHQLPIFTPLNLSPIVQNNFLRRRQQKILLPHATPIFNLTTTPTPIIHTSYLRKKGRSIVTFKPPLFTPSSFPSIVVTDPAIKTKWGIHLFNPPTPLPPPQVPIVSRPPFRRRSSIYFQTRTVPPVLVQTQTPLIVAPAQPSRLRRGVVRLLRGPTILPPTPQTPIILTKPIPVQRKQSRLVLLRGPVTLPKPNPHPYIITRFIRRVGRILVFRNIPQSPPPASICITVSDFPQTVCIVSDEAC